MGKEVLDKVLAIDPIYEMEKATGKHWSEFSEDEMMEAMFFNMFSGELKKATLQKASDTYFGIAWESFLDLIKANGFKEGLGYKFTHNIFGTNETEQAVLFYREDGLVIWATSHHGKLNGGTLYGELIKNPEAVWANFPDFSGGFYDENHLSFTTDVREGLFHFLERMKENGEFAPVWGERDRFLWFVDFKEEHEPDYDYKKISNEKISAAADGLKRIILGSI